MKSFLQKYESITHYILAASIAFLGLGIYIYVNWTHAGALLAILGSVGFIWCFFRR